MMRKPSLMFVFVAAVITSAASGEWRSSEKIAVIDGRTFKYSWCCGTGYTNAWIHSISPKDGDIIIPAAIGGIPVTSLSKLNYHDYGFADNTTTSIHLPSAITEIPNNCFKDCTSLTNINLECITYYGYRAFQNCYNLEVSIHVTSNTTFGIDYYPRAGGACYNFLNCRKIKNVTFDENVKLPTHNGYVGEGIFQGCGIEHIELSSSIKSLGNDTFANTDLKEVVIPDGMEDISSSFCACTNLAEVTIGSSVRSMQCAFAGCTSLREVEFSGNTSLTNISDGAFRGCTDLNEITIPEGIVSIGQEAFGSASSLCRVKLPDCLEEIGSGAFRATGFTELVIPGHVKTVNGSFWGCDNLTNVIVRSGVESIHYAFSSCTNLVKVTLPEGLLDISSAFSGCWALEDVNIPSTVTNMSSAFYNCSGLTSVTIPDSVTSIGNYAFYRCRGLTSVTIPASVTNISDYAFGGVFRDFEVYKCSGLTNVTFKGNAPTVGYGAFSFVSEGCVALVSRNSTGWGVGEGEKWNGLTLKYSDAAPTPKTYTLTLNPNGGTYKNKATAHKIPNSSQTTKPTYGKSYYWRVGAATRTGYIFKGWYDAATGGKQVYDANGEAVDGDYWKGSGKTATWAYDDNVTLYAQWAKACTVRFYPNGSGSTLSGSIFGASDGQSKTATVTFGLKSDINNVVGVAKRSGYVFLGWYTQRDAGGLVFDANGNCRKGGAFWNSKGCWIKESNVSLYAHWAKAYTVRFYPNGSGSTLSGSIFGASDGQSKTATVTFGLKSDINNVVGVAKRPGYTFMGWYTQRDAGGLVFDANGKCRKGGAFWNSSGCWIKESNVSLYAHWTKVSASAPISEVFTVSAPTCYESETVDGVAYLPDGESFPVEVRLDADGFAVVELEDAIFCGYVADGVGELFSGDRTLYLIVSP